MSKQFSKFSPVGRKHFKNSLASIDGDKNSCYKSLEPYRPCVRAVLLQVAAGEGIHPEFVRVNLAGCVKSAALRATVYTIPTKSKGLRIQSSDVVLGEPGIGKGLGYQWRDDLLESTKALMMEYAQEELRKAINPQQGEQNHQREQGLKRKRFKYVDGIERLADMELPFLIDLPNGSAEAVFTMAAHNSGTGVIPILEYIQDKQTIVDKTGANGLFLASHDSNVKAMVYKTTESIPEITKNAMFWQIYINLEDSLDWFKTAGNNGTTRRVCYCYADYGGMDSIPRRSCRDLNRTLKKRLQTLFTVIRHHHPLILKFNFGEFENELEDVQDDGIFDIIGGQNLHEEGLSLVFNNEKRCDTNLSDDLIYLRGLAKDIATETLHENDTSIRQLTQNLISIIGQKSAEMNLLHSVLSRDDASLKTYLTNIFVEKRGLITLNRADINEAAASVRRSRMILLAFNEAKEFEENFHKIRSKIPKTYFSRTDIPITNAIKAMIFTVNYIQGRKTIAKSIKQSLKKNCSFKAFSEDLDTTIAKLQEMELLVTEIKDHRAKRDINGVSIVRQERFYKLNFNRENEEHKIFLSQYQVIYPGAIIE